MNFTHVWHAIFACMLMGAGVALIIFVAYKLYYPASAEAASRAEEIIVNGEQEKWAKLPIYDPK